MFFFMVLHTSCGAVRFVFSTLSARLLKIYSCPPALSIGFTKSLQNRRKTMLFRPGEVNPLRRYAPDSPFCRCATSSPGAGEVFPLGGSFYSTDRQMQKSSPFRGSWQSRKALTERVLLLASSPSQSSLRDASSPKVGALGSPRKLHLFAKASPFGRGGTA